jgi:hypothetical protein
MVRNAITLAKGPRVDVSRHRELNEVDDDCERRRGQHPSEGNLSEGSRLFRSALMDSKHQADHDGRKHEDEDLCYGKVRVGQRVARVADRRESRDEHGDVGNFSEEDRTR